MGVRGGWRVFSTMAECVTGGSCMGWFGAINASNCCNRCSMTVSFFSKVQTVFANFA